ncbi:OstA family protein [Panacibacter sp. DH6]|uniref:OstA family protein n=1 Tax=Panacibacter microcysteis TaxID=2793269 RepID=A0A931GY63_9BACT|nr:OstA-like protein [Panacibacter microcysteis]MBG9374742.1 OstA family protein [Panacibacter microcysteis]
MKKLFLLFYMLLTACFLYAQQPIIVDSAGQKQINIIHADKISFKKVDSLTEYQLLVGHVAVQQEKTLFYCDSAAINTKSNILEAFRKVHINDNDSLHIYSDYLKYLGKEKKAYLNGNVKLTDGKGTLTTSKLDYDLNTHIGNYYEGGKVVNGKTVLTSKEGFYYEDTRDVYFKKDVVLVDPEYTIKTDTLLYNTYTGIATFVVPTTIVSDSGRRTVRTKDGYYDTKTKKTYFGQRTEVWDKATFITADEMASEDSTGLYEARGKVIYRDTAQKVTLFANHLNGNRKNSSFLATEKPVMIIEQEEGDSLFVAADTMYSARLSDLKKYRTVPVITELSSQKDTAIPVKETAPVFEQAGNDDETVTDSLNMPPAGKPLAERKELPRLPRGKQSPPDSTQQPQQKLITQQDSTVTVKKDTADTLKDTLLTAAKRQAMAAKDSLIAMQDTVFSKDSATASDALAKKDAAMQKVVLADTSTFAGNDSTDRFFEAYYHVRIFSDSLQAVGDSLFYSGEDSAFRLFKQPVVWARESQVTGDTMYLYTQNKKPSRLYVFENALTVNKVGSNYYNQVKGRTINGYFKNGNMDFLRAKSNAESIYYAQDESNKFIGVNQATADIIDMYFQEKKPQKVVFRNNLVGTTYPMRQVNHEELKLRGFKWLEDQRPKSKYELFAD